MNGHRTLPEKEGSDPNLQRPSCNIGALIITYTSLGVPYYNYSITGPKPYSNC